MSVEITTTVDYNPDTDYILVEQHEEFETESSGGRVKETWKLEQLGGLIPLWAVFPTAWQAWVWNRTVLASAIQYLRRHFPMATNLLQVAASRESKHNKANAWRAVGDALNADLSKRLGTPTTLGKFAGHSWTAVAAMPMRLALRVSQNIHDQWIPPVPKPEYENPETSGRYLLANLYGAYPTQGPGVDHAPATRPFTGMEGELKNV